MWSFRRRKSFKKSYDRLTPEQKRAVREAWPRFREDPFNPQFRTHQIQRLQKFYGKTVYSVVLLADLRALFILDGQTVVFVDIGTHKIYG